MRSVANELRKPNGEWTANPETLAKYAATSDRLAAADRADKTVKVAKAKRALNRAAKASKKSADLKVNISGKNLTLTRAAKIVGDTYEWPQRDKQGAVAADAPSIVEQDRAQIVAKCWSSSVSGSSPSDEQYAASLWEQYQSPSLYEKINATLRTGKSKKGEPKAADMRKYAALMFEKGGYDVEKPTTVYRALKSDDTDWAAKLTPGTTFTDKGIVSTTAHSKFSRGWLLGDAKGDQTREEKRDDVVMEIHLPTGHRVVGGDPQFIETMLAPGTSFKVLSSERLVGDTADPLGGDVGPPLFYTHVVAEVTP